MEKLNQVLDNFFETFNNLITPYWVKFSVKFTSLLDQLFVKANKSFGIDETTFSVAFGITFLLLSLSMIKLATIVARDLSFSIRYLFSRNNLAADEPILLENRVEPNPLESLLELLSSFRNLLFCANKIISSQGVEKQRSDLLERLRSLESDLIEHTGKYLSNLPSKEKPLPLFPIELADDAVLFANILIDTISGDGTGPLRLKKDFEAVFHKLIVWNKMTIRSAKAGSAFDSRPVPRPMPA